MQNIFHGIKKGYKNITITLNKHSSIFLALYTVLTVGISRVLMYCSYYFSKAENEAFRGGVRAFMDAMNIWDTMWYKDMIEEGYYVKPLLSGVNYSNTAFFPIVPFFYKMVDKVLGGNIYYWGSIMNTLIFTLALFVAGKYIILTRKKIWQAVTFVTIMSFGVYSFYYSIFYTEAIFFFFLVLNFYFMRKEKYILAGLAGLLCGATRNLGVFLVFPMMMQFLIICYDKQLYVEMKPKTIPGHLFAYMKVTAGQVLGNTRFLLGLCLTPAGFFSYMLYLRLRFGDGFAFLHVQKAWFRGNTGIWDTLKGTISLEGDNLYCFCVIFAALISIYMLFYKKQYAELVFALIYMYIPMSFGGTYSLARFLSAGFVYFLGFTDLLEKLDSKVITVFVLIILAMFEYQFVQIWCFGDATILN